MRAERAELLTERRMAWRVAIAMFVTGAVTTLGAFPAPDPDPSDRGWFLPMAAIFAVSAFALWRAGPRSWTVRVSTVTAIACISLVVGVSRPLAATPFFYIWCTLFVAYFGSRREFVVLQGLMAVAFAVALSFSTAEVRTTVWIGAVSATLVAGLVVNHQRSRVARLVSELRATAATDPLTGLVNRREFAERFADQLEEARAAARPLTLAIFDIDHFKSVNDRFGHANGDLALVRVADTLREGVREGDLVCRFGGEEFAVMLADTELADGHALAERIAGRVPEAMPGFGEDGEGLTVSAGVASLSADAGSLDDLMHAADAALYEAKQAGRDRVLAARVAGAAPA